MKELYAFYHNDTYGSITSGCFALRVLSRPRFIFVVMYAWGESPRPHAITSIDLFVVVVLNLQIFT